MLIVGIDPGAKGSLSVLANEAIYFIDFKSHSLQGYIKILKDLPTPDIVIVEKVHSMPKQGVVSTFSFGQRVGEIEGMLQTLQFPYELVLPSIWQRSCGIALKSDKKTIATIISKLYPKAELYNQRGTLLDGRSDALGLAHYGRLKYTKGNLYETD